MEGVLPGISTRLSINLSKEYIFKKYSTNTDTHIRMSTQPYKHTRMHILSL
jgi:hypothetical protein